MDIIYIEQLSVITTIGIYDWERNFKQKLIFNVEIGWNNTSVDRNNDIKCYLDYSDISNKIISYVENHCFALLEEVAEKVVQLIFNCFNVLWVRIKVSKPNAVVHAKNVSVIIERNQNSKSRIKTNDS